jgi:TatD DNase family protein
MMALPSLDAHAHLAPTRRPEELLDCGMVLANTLSLEEGEQAAHRHDRNIAWGVGCHPRFLRSQESFQAARFRAAVEQLPFVGEVGLDSGSRLPLETQLRTFQQVLEIAAHLPRLVSIHSFKASGLVLQELERKPIPFPVLHWWTGTVAETKKAVALGCYFSIHSQVARNSKFRLHVPRERILLESDHGYNDPPPAIPSRIQWVEYLVAQQYALDVKELRQFAWRNFARIVRLTDTTSLFPKEFGTLCAKIEETG